MITQLISNPLGFFRQVLLILPALVIGFSFHGFAHAWVADKLGDDTPRLQGRLTLSPLANVDPIGLGMMLLLGFGYARPVVINPNNFKNRRRDFILVSLAGVTVNFVISFLACGLWFFLVTRVSASIDVYTIVYNIFIYNLVMIIFNLLPIPPLDGYNVVKNLLINNRTVNFFWTLERYGQFILIFLLVSGLIDRVLIPLLMPLANFIMSIWAKIL